MAGPHRYSASDPGLDEPMEVARTDDMMIPPPPANMSDIPWYHFNITRHVAESVLISMGEDGSYLLRDSTTNPGEFALSVRAKNSVKHFPVRYDGQEFSFGFGQFSSVSELLEHFESKPVIGGESGVLTLLKYPYPRCMEEPDSYDPIRDHAEWGESSQPPAATAKKETAPAFTIASKEGYLAMLGQHRKTWRTRWCVLLKNEMSYYKSNKGIRIRTINLKDVVDIMADNSQGEPNCFKIITTYRTFFLYASSAQGAEDWIKILRWKLNQKESTQQSIDSTSMEEGLFSLTMQSPTIRYLSQLKVTRDWYKLGRKLGVSQQQLDKFRQEYPRDEEICKNKMFGVWLGSSNPTFHSLLTGLMAIGRKELAESISEKEGIPLPKEEEIVFEEDKKLLEEAMKEGYINASFLKVIFTGAGGVGKTHAVCLLRGADPPDPNHRQSTDCATKAVTLRVDAANDEKWEEIDLEKRRKIIAEGICAAKVKKEQQPAPTPIPKVQPQPEPEPTPKPEQKPQQQPLSQVDTKLSTTELELVKRIHEAVMSGEVSGEIMGIKWVYAVDTGGQPPFHELLSAFIKGASVCAFVFKLSESLGHRPLVEYWVDGTEVGQPFKHPLSNRQILEQSVQTIQALPGLSSEYSKSDYSTSPLLLVIGTHRDKQDECTDETLEDKEAALHDILKKSGCNFLYNTHKSVERVVFDVNAKTPEQKDKDIASTLRRVIASKMPKPEQIPLRHYGLELELEQLATTKPVISMEECRAIGDRLNFDEEGLKAALRFLHRLNALLYYPEVKEVEKLIFCDPLVLIKIASKVAEHIHRGATKAWKDSGERGLISVEQLNGTEFHSYFQSELFNPKNLFKLFEHLLIVAMVEEKEQQFFMPCLLDELKTTDLEKRRPKFPCCNPLTFQFCKQGRSVYAPSGLFSALVAFLLSLKDRDSERCSWVIAESSGKLYRNIITFRSDMHPVRITLMNFHTSFEVFVMCRPEFLYEHLPEIRSIILKGLEAAKKVRNFDHVYYKEAFACKCSKGTSNPHLAEIYIKGKSWSCPDNPLEGGPLEPTELVWYKDFPSGSGGSGGGSSPGATDGYSKLQCKRDTIIQSLADLGFTRKLAEKLLGANMITSHIYDLANNFAPGVVETDRTAVLFNAVLAGVKLNPGKYNKFISILKEVQGSDDLVAFIEAA